MHATFRCLVCRKLASEPFLLDCRDLFLRKPQVVNYYRCSACGLVQQSPVPIDVGPFYEAYPVHQDKSRLYSLIRRSLLSGVYLPPRKFPRDSVLLDFGCGDGWYLEWCREESLAVVGFEHDAEHAESLSRRLGIEVFADLEALERAYAGGFDVITLHFVAEHLTDLHSVFSSLRRLLKPGGMIRYVVPNIASWEFRVFGRRWHSLDAPRHISFPDARHAGRLATELGLSYEGETAVAFPNGFGGSLPTALFGSFSTLFFLATLPLATVVTRLFPGGNKAYVLRRSK